MAQLFWLSGQTLVDGTGTPYALAKASFFETGTTTPKATYSNAGLSSANTNPVVADSDGRFGDIYLVAGRYKVVLATSADVTIDTLDPVDGVLSLIESASAPSPTYAFMRYHNTSDGNVYRRNSSNAAWINEGPVDGLGNAASVTQQLAGTATDAFSTPDSVAGLWQRGADIASASTLSLPAGGGGVFNITGTTGITGISSAQGGRTIKLKFAASLTITHNATSMILPGGVNITTRAGDIAEFTNEAAADASGSNWRLTDYLRNLDPIETPSSAKTTNYTVAATDRNGLIRFSGASSDSTLTLPAVSGLAGFKVTFVNLDGPTYGVTVDANGSETIDGYTTRKTFGNDPVTLFCDGSAWHTISGSYVYCSGNQTITAAGALALTHGLGSRPNDIWGEIECTTINASYAVGDRVVVAFPDSDGTRTGCAVYADATNVNVRFGSSANLWSIPDKSSGTATSITNSSWRLRVYARS